MSRIGDLIFHDCEDSPRISNPLSVSELLNPAPSRKRPLVHYSQPEPKRPCFSTPELIDRTLAPNSPTLSEASTLSNLSSPVSECPESPDCAYQDRFTSSRIIGQKHRDREDEVLELLEERVQSLLKDKNSKILELCIRRQRHGLSQNELSYLRVLLKREVREKRGQSYHRVSDKAAAILGAEYWSGATALILLEMIATRRNLVEFPRDVGKRRRKNTLECAPESVFDQLMRTAISNVKVDMGIVEQLPNISKEKWSQVVLDWVAEAQEGWSKHEDSTNPPGLNDYPLPSDPDVDLNVNNPLIRPRNDVYWIVDQKRCTRCKKDKTAGKGHRRSHCDDGYDIASKEPYVDKNNGGQVGNSGALPVARGYPTLQSLPVFQAPV